MPASAGAGGGGEVGVERCAECFGVLGGGVDAVGDAVDGEVDGFALPGRDRGAVEVVDRLDDDVLRDACVLPFRGGCPSANIAALLREPGVGMYAAAARGPLCGADQSGIA